MRFWNSPRPSSTLFYLPNKLNELRCKDMESCWAHCLGNCNQKLSGEHLVSESLFTSERVSVQGFQWCKESPKEIGLSSFTAKILCSRHNSALSPVDEAGGKAFAALREMRRLSNIREKLRPQVWHIVKRSIDGKGLERWFLKTLINLCHNQGHPIGLESPTAGRPSEHLVRTAFGLEPFAHRAGLYSIVRTGMECESTDTISFAPLIKQGSQIEGGLFGFRGLRFLLFLNAEGPPDNLAGIIFEGEDLGACQMNFHNSEIRENTGKHRSQILTIKW